MSSKGLVEDDGVGELLDYNLSVEEAEKLEVPWGPYQLLRSLRWIALNHPATLDRLLDEYPPGNLIFYALVLVNGKYEEEIAIAVNSRNERIRKTIISKVNRIFILPSVLHNKEYWE